MSAELDEPINVRSESLLPFLKWAGGKRWLVPKLLSELPPCTGTYIEPFLGGGAMFFAYRPDKAVLSDTNEDLIGTYEALKHDWQAVWDRLNWHQERHSTEHYYFQRAQRESTPAGEAARFIYLNRACFNGLYRVNLKGEFNVPKGSKSTIVFEYDNFQAISSALQHADLRCVDFESRINRAGKGDLVFLDPPYTVKHNMNGFVKYNENLFSWNDQIRLRDAAVRATARGAIVLVTNADHLSVRDLYRRVGTLRKVARSSKLSADSQYRVGVTELLIRMPPQA